MREILALTLPFVQLIWADLVRWLQHKDSGDLAKAETKQKAALVFLFVFN